MNINLNDTIKKQIAIERLENIKQLGLARIGLVSAFFVLHLIMGWVLNEPTFRGKELLFSTYLALTALLFFFHKGKLAQNINPISLALIDIPMATLIMAHWTLEVDALGMLRIGGLALSFNLFFIHMSSFLLSRSRTILTFFASVVSVAFLQLTTNTHQNTIIVSQLLLFIFLLTTLYKNKKVYLLIKKSYQEQAKIEKLSRYFSPNIASFLQTQSELNPAGNEAEVTVLFADIRDFTKLSESMSGQEVVSLLNALHERLVECIFSCGGTLDKYMGDGIMAYFGAPIADPCHADKAFECAQKMKKAMADFNADRKLKSQEPLAIGIGLHSGKVVIGDIGANVRREYTIIGDTVNTASRIEALTKKHQLDFLATEAVCERLQSRDDLRFVSEESIRGKTQSVKTYTN